MIDVGPGPVPKFIMEEVLPSAPKAGEGVHRFLFDLARVLTPYRTADSIDQILRNYADGCGRRVPDTEIKDAIRAGARYAWQPNAATNLVGVEIARAAQPPEAKFKPEAFEKFVAPLEGIDAEWLYRRSPIAPWNRTPASFLHAVYRQGEKIVIFDDYHSQGQAVWVHPGLPYDARTLNVFAFRKRLGVWFLANPTDGQFRINDAGKMSRRSHQNITAWRFMVVESDRTDITAAQWLAALAQLPLPIAAICETGGRLAHALLRIDAESKEEWDQIRDRMASLLIMIGADCGSLSAVRV
jgi:hypothetical protein